MQKIVDEVFNYLNKYPKIETAAILEEDGIREIARCKTFKNGELFEGKPIYGTKTFAEALAKTNFTLGLILGRYKNIWIRVMPEWTYSEEYGGHYIRFRIAYCNDKENVA